MQNQTCVPSKILGEGLEYEDAPKGSSEIFWFAPGLMKSWVRIDKGQLPYSIPIQKLDAQLKIENDRWVLERRN